MTKKSGIRQYPDFSKTVNLEKITCPQKKGKSHKEITIPACV